MLALLWCLSYHELAIVYTLTIPCESPVYLVNVIPGTHTHVLQPTIIQDLGYSAAEAQLLTVPPYALATILTVIVAIVSERMRMRAPFVMASSAFAAIGYIILLANTEATTIMATDPITMELTPVPAYVHPAISYVGVFFATAGIYPASALALSWPAVNVSGQTKRATAGGMQIMIGNTAAIFGTQLYRSEWSPGYIVGHSFCLVYLVLNALLAGFTWWYLRRENKRRDALEQSKAEGTGNGEWQGDEDLRFRFTT